MTALPMSPRRARGLSYRVVVLALIFGHLGIVTIFVLGRTVNADIGFTVSTVRSLATGPLAPTLHTVAALALLAALWRGPRWQDGAAITTAAVWLGQTALLIASAATRAAPIPLYAQVLVVPITIIALATAVTWGFAHDEQE